MRFVCFNTTPQPDGPAKRYRIGAFVDGKIADLTPAVLPTGLTAAEILRCYDLSLDFITPAAEAVASGTLTTFVPEEITFEAPVPRPGKIICIGLNYLDHVIESGAEKPKSPLIFSKFVTCVAPPFGEIVLPPDSTEVDYEAELAVVIGRQTQGVSAGEAMESVFGYTNFNDVSARDLQFADGQWQRGKSCDTFAPFGPFIATRNEIEDPHKLRISFRLNGETLQDSNTDQLIFRIPELIEFVSRFVTLEPGDIIATGTPPGVGFARKPPIFLKDGDLCEVEVEGLGVLSNRVAGVKN